MAVSLAAPILIVDDYNTMIRILRNLLRQLGFTQIDEASDGRAAINKMRGSDYQLVISDWDMEPMGGAELMKWMRSIERCRNTPIVMVAKQTGDAEHCRLRPTGGTSRQLRCRARLRVRPARQ